MKKLIMLMALIVVAMVSVSQNKTGTVVNGRTSLKYPINFTAADTIDASETYWVLVDSRQDYAQIPSIAITLDSLSGAPSIAISLEGKASTLDEYTEIVAAATWDSEDDNPFSIVASSGVNYRYFKIKFVATATAQKTKVTALTFSTTYQNISVVSATTGTFSSNVTVGGTLGITGATTATGLITANGGVTLGAGDDLIGSSTSDITFNTNKFTVAGATGNTVIAGTLNTTGTIDNVVTNSAAGGDKALNAGITQIAGTALTGNLIGAGIVATNGTTTAPTGVIYGIEAKARAANASNEGGAVTGRLTGVYASVDAKTKEATTMRAFEASLDGGAGGTSTEAVAFEAFNNSSATQTASYAFSANGGTASGHKAYTADLRLQNGALVNNSSTSLLTITEANVDVDGAFTASSIASDGAVSGTSITGTSVISPIYDVTGAAGITIGSADVTGITLSGISEDLVLTPSENTWTLSTSTGVTAIAAGGLNLTGVGTIGSGKLSSTGGVDIGTSQSLTGTTAITIGSGTATTAITSSDWGIDATGIATGLGNITSNGLVSSATLNTSGLAQVSTINFADATAVAGTSDAITIDFTTDLTVATGTVIYFIAEAANTGAATLAVDGGAAAAIVESSDGSALEAGDIPNGGCVQLMYDGTSWQQLSQSGN